MKMEPIVSSETSAIRTQTPGNYPKRNKLRLEHGESLKTRTHNIRFHADLPGGSRVVPYGQRDMSKLTAAFRERYANAPKNRRLAPTPNLYVKPRMHKQFKISIWERERERERSHSWLRVELWALAFTVWHCNLVGAGRRFGETFCCCVQGKRHTCMSVWKPKVLFYNNGLLCRRIANWTQNGEDMSVRPIVCP